jgi:hypothetical protein
MGIDHAYVPPHQQSLNEAEKLADRMFESARTLVFHSKAPDWSFGLALQYSIYVDIRSSTTDSRDFKTPYEIACGLVPDISRLHRFWTKCHVVVPKSKRKALAKKGLHNLRAEPGRFVGFQSLFSHTYAVILDGPTRPLVHSVNVTFDDANYTNSKERDVPASNTQFEFGAAPPEEARFDEPRFDECQEFPPDEDSQHFNNSAFQPQVVIGPCPPMPSSAPEFLPDTDDWFYGESPVTGPRPRPPEGAFASMQYVNYVLMASSDESLSTDDDRAFEVACYVLAAHATKDMDWKEALAGPEVCKVVEALQKEMDSLTSTILTRINEDDPEFEEALKLATPGRLILDIKRSGLYKARGVKQGFLEDPSVDGPDFNYYAHVAKLTSVRALLFRYKRGTRRVALKDIKTAFLQSDPYPEGTVKYICFKNPLTQKWEYFRQSGPIYGEASAPRRFADTLAPYMQASNDGTGSSGCGMTRGMNEPCCFHEENRDLLALLYVDDCIEDGEEDDIEWLSSKLDDRFECKDQETLGPDTPVDCLGISLSQDEKYTYADMSSYIKKCLKVLGWEDLKPVSTPVDTPIDPESSLLPPDLHKKAMTALGMAGWLSLTVRCDIAYAHSRTSQHQSKLTESAYQNIQRIFRYLKGTHDYGIRAPLYDDYQSCAHSAEVDPRYNIGWELFVDSDFASNCEEQNNRRSQNGYIALLNGAPVLWSSKVSSVAFADERIGQAHPNMSSGAAEVYAAANASMDFLHFNHVMQEMNIPFPEPYCLQIDNTAAKAFAKGTAQKSKLKHIDVRQGWVKVLRDSSICKPVHVPTKLNLADLFTKILNAPRFRELRDRVLHRIPTVARM